MPEIILLDIVFKEVDGTTTEQCSGWWQDAEHFRIASIPLMTTQVGYGDVVKLEPIGNEYEVKSVAERSGWTTTTFVLATEACIEDRVSAVVKRLNEIGGVWERSFGGVLAISLPPNVEYDPSADLFGKEEPKNRT